MLQGVREVFEIVDMDGGAKEKGGDAMDGKGKMVLIGRGLEKVDLGRSLQGCLEYAGREAKGQCNGNF